MNKITSKVDGNGRRKARLRSKWLKKIERSTTKIANEEEII